MYLHKKIETSKGSYVLYNVYKQVFIDKELGVGSKTQIRIDFIQKNGKITEIPWDLKTCSKVINYFLFKIWPPLPKVANVIDFYLNDENELTIIFETDENEVPFYPFGWDKASIWSAVLCSTTNKWSLKRINYL